ncbi:MAG TPA: tetratricopeptide repeat protein [Terriglobales bacterium]|jgi:tetratricopeptide (TPR) repeat protein|nr:tetratricopeptide repeat protein [Terriglobales bacterium]
MKNFLLPARAGISGPQSQNPHRSLLRKVFFASFYVALVLSSASSSPAQETESVGDAARAFRARRAAQGNQDAKRPVQSPLAATTLVEWQIAGMAVPEVLNEVQTRGISFATDDAHLQSLKDADLAPELLAALPHVPSHPDASSSSEIPQALTAAAQAFTAKEYASARHSLESLTAQDANLYAALGNLHFVTRDFASAKTAFARSAELDPSFVYAHVRLAQIYYRLEQGSQVAEEAKQALRLQPTNAEAHKYLALSSTMQMQDSGGAAAGGANVEDLSDLKAGGSTEAKNLNNQALALAQQNEWAKAEAAYNRAIELDPSVAMYYYNLGNLYTKWRHPQQALAALNKAKALAPRNMAVRQNLGYTMCQFNLFSDAVTEFREMLDMDPHWNMARPCLIKALDSLGRKTEADQVEMDYKLYKNSDDSGDSEDGDSNEDDNGVKL